jgi:hypothetical protein
MKQVAVFAVDRRDCPVGTTIALRLPLLCVFILTPRLHLRCWLLGCFRGFSLRLAQAHRTSGASGVVKIPDMAGSCALRRS